ncbi:NAD(P)-dependent oxidoreductase [Allochromatium vinosum]|uniref:6-phosphogluconate dehydrogenase NAD-binding protein n=1 Tax=Allochromatium vinosum (strain ATCC 17899 / DSM 180 / NBRC 103801 / NCIMB 10441 / D) TaxID=572477 RepID=D3RS27_ALLVD|nr:NAD(P)-dependent oxidoreductase [Allochromatium vinosum]ADC63964.1 6-phosphogluconate dehydrogenase NAD-binding protein [Allochromatium vinosum DSM 180]
MKIAVLGMGLLGSEIALRLKRQGHEVIGWNRGVERAESARQRGLTLAASAWEAIDAAEMTLLLLSDARAILDTLFEQGDADALAGRILVQMGTIAPRESQEIADHVAAQGGEYLEAPVLGSLPEAREGTLILMAGSDPDLYERCLPVFRDLSRDPRLIGAVGQGAALKLAMNQLIAGLTATFSLSLGLVRREGLAIETFMELLRASALHAKTFDKKLDKYLAHDYGAANFPLKHLRKDVALFRRVAEEAGLDTRLIEAIESGCLQAESMGYGEADYSALYEALAPRRADPS